MKLFEIKLTYTPPNFEQEWDEVERYPELADFGKSGWISLARHGKRIRLSKLKDVSNMDHDLAGLDSDKVARAQKAYQAKSIELPIVVRINGENDLLGGNTRIAFLLDQDIDPLVWFIDVEDLFNKFDK